MQGWGTICLLGLGLMAAGCSTGRVYRMYEGQPQPADKIARLMVPNAIDVYSIDGKVVYDFFLKAGKSEVQLLPGPHSIVARYDVVWNEGSETHQIVKSGLIGMTFDAQAGHLYRIAFPEPQDVASAAKFADHVKLWIEDLTSPASAPKPAGDSALSSNSTGTPSNAPATLPAFAPVAASNPSMESLPLQNLKFWWQKADEQDRRQFRDWSTNSPIR